MSIVTFIIVIIVIFSLAAIGGSISERSGVINLSIEGFMTIGAIVYAMMASRENIVDNLWAQLWMMPLAGLITGLFAWAYGTIVVKLKANQTIAGIALNTLALSISLFLIHSNMNPEGVSDRIIIQDTVLAAARAESNPLFLINIITILGLFIIGLTILMLNKTKLGIKIKTCGEKPDAAISLGMKVHMIQIIAVSIAGMIAGIAGAMLIQSQSNVFLGSTQGIGFLAVAIVIFGQWRPTYMIGGAIVFGIFYGIALKYILIPGFSVFIGNYKDFLQILPYSISLLVLVITQKKTKAPKALGIPFEYVK